MTMHRSLVLPLALSLSLASACATEPIEDIGQVPPLTGVVSGEALILAPLDNPAPVYLFLASVTHGEAGPELGPTVDTVIIPASEMGPEGETLFGRSGPFTFPAVAPGLYAITGLVDGDNNFNLIIPELAVGTEGDLEGAYVGDGAGVAVLEVVGGEALTQINVIFSAPSGGSEGTPTPAPSSPTPDESTPTPTPTLTPTVTLGTPSPTEASPTMSPSATLTPPLTSSPSSTPAPSPTPTASDAPSATPSESSATPTA